MKQRARRGRLERLLFSFMGPPQLGGTGAGKTPASPAPSAVRCARCGLSYDAHEVVRGPRLTYSRCPTAGPNGRAS